MAERRTVILAIDPGPERSALLVFDGVKAWPVGILDNHEVRRRLYVDQFCADGQEPDVLAVERMSCYGRPVGDETFDTVEWTGRFMEAWACRAVRVRRMEVKMHVCHDSRANDAHIRQALIDRFGPSRKAAIGTKKAPGPLYGVVKDLWAALAVAVTAWDRLRETTEE